MMTANNSTSETAVASVPVPVNDVPEDLICCICFSIPLNPAIVTQCEHFFCSTCIRQALHGSTGASSSCPVCRLKSPQIEPLSTGSLVYRLWSSILVKCSHHEQGSAWKGPIVDFERHQSDDCQFGQECQQKRHQQQQVLANRIQELEKQLTLLRRENTEIQVENMELQRRVQTSQQATRRPTSRLPDFFDGSYNYDRDDIIKLSQLISRYLEDKPDEIDSNKIFNCVKNRYDDLTREYSDNPEHYELDMRMLLTTCAASTWFTDSQYNNICSWINNYDWTPL